MSTTTSDRPIQRSCALAAHAAGESPVGWAISGRRFLLVETALPWPSDIFEARALPPGLAALLRDRSDLDPAFEAIAPEPDLTQPGRTRVVLYDSSGSPGPLRRREFLVPPNDVTDLVAAWCAGLEVGVGEEPGAAVRDIVVCAHGAHDACCGRFGVPLYRRLVDHHLRSGLRVWRGSHTGGHRFAPTLLDLPDARSWGHLRPDDLDLIVCREGHPRAVRARYRGLGTLMTFQERLVEAELLVERGWRWLALGVRGAVVAGTPRTYAEDLDGTETPAVVRLTAFDPATQHSQTWEAVVERTGEVMTVGECGQESWPSPTFGVTALRTVP